MDSDLAFRNKNMRKAGKIASKILQQVCAEAKEGISLLELDDLAESLCYKYETIPAFKGYDGFPNTLCVGVNDVVVHGIPDNYRLQSGDIVSLDFGLIYKKVYSDTAYTVMVGNVSDEVKKFVQTVEKALYAGIEQAVVGNRIGDIGFAMQSLVEANGYSVVREMVGHCIGYQLHEDPYIPGYGKNGTGEQLFDGQALAIEAIVNMGRKEIYINRKDGWTSRTKDGSLSGLFEHTVLVGQKPEILTVW